MHIRMDTSKKSEDDDLSLLDTPTMKDVEASASPTHRNTNSDASSSYTNRLAWVSMILLVIQGTAMSVVLRFSRTTGGRPYLPSVSVLLAEMIKLSICVVMESSDTKKDNLIKKLLRVDDPILPVSSVVSHNVETDKAQSNVSSTEKRKSYSGCSRMLLSVPFSPSKRKIIKDSFYHALPMALPAGMFAFQQVLLIAAATYLDAVTYQILNQASKLVPTAIFARVLLGQKLSPMQWTSIPVLAGGVILVTLNNGSSNSSSHTMEVSSADWIFGMIACSTAGVSSAYAGVYFEKYLKGKHAASLWTRNIQLGIFGVPFCFLYAYFKDGLQIQQHGWLQGFTASAWIVVALQVFGGLVIGMVTKYTSSVLKNFALAISVILTVIVAIPLFNQWPSVFFLFGVTLVLTSVFMYSNGAKRNKQEHGTVSRLLNNFKSIKN